MDCRLKQNQSKNRCKILRSIRNKPKTHLSWKQAKAKYPKLSPKGNVDGDSKLNKKDCRPFNKKKQDLDGGPYDFTENTLLVSPKTYRAYEIVRFGKEVEESPSEIRHKIKNMGYTDGDLNDGLSLYRQYLRGRDIRSFEGV